MKKFIKSNPLSSMLLFPFAPTLILIYLVIYVDAANLVFLFGVPFFWVASLPWIIYCTNVTKAKGIVIFFSLLIWILFLLLVLTFSFQGYVLKTQWPSKVDYVCLNMCKSTVKGMTIGELNSFCMKRCSRK